MMKLAEILRFVPLVVPVEPVPVELDPVEPVVEEVDAAVVELLIVILPEQSEFTV